MKSYSADDVALNPTAFAYKPNDGFKYVGALPMPRNPIFVPSECEPSAVPHAENGSWHDVLPPEGTGAPAVRMQWNPTTKVWSPPIQQGGRRCAYSSAYLAAHGWKYGAPA